MMLWIGVVAGTCIAFAAAGLWISMILATKRLCVSHVEYTSAHVPAELDGFVIAHISDLHVERLRIDPREIVRQIGYPDVVLWTGDYADHVAARLPQFMPYWQQVRGVHPPVVAWGNHDYWGGEESLSHATAMASAQGVITLRNQWHQVVPGLIIHGVGYGDYGDCLPQQALDGAPADGFHLWLVHDPHDVSQVPADHAHLALCGHLHGGQVNLPFGMTWRLHPMGPLPRQGIICGWHTICGIATYISQGMGQSGYNLRWGSRPEVLCLTLRRAARP